MANSSFDVVVIGGGPGGYVAAIRASQLGLSAAVIEREHLGGVCLNWGCIPTKTLLRSSEINHMLNNLDGFGFSVKEASFDIEKIVKRSRMVSNRLKAGVKHLLKKNKVDVFEGAGRLIGPGKVAVEGEDGTMELEAKHIVLATGARPRTLAGLEPDGELIWTYKEAMVPKAMPKSLLVIGSGAIGIEFASFYHDLGAEVTVVEVLDRILPVEDEEISELARKALEGQGMTIMTGATVSALETGQDSIGATVTTGDRSIDVTAERCVLAVGITGNVENIGIEGTGVEVANGHVTVDPMLRTGEPGVYAIGDLVGPPWLAHKASHEAVVCIDAIAGRDPHPLDTSNIPGCTYCRPQIASIGMTEAAAQAAGRKVRIGRFPFMANGKAIALDEKEGLIKTVFDSRTGELLGAHMIGAEVTELIQGFAVARALEATEAELIETVFPHPTLSEMMHESILDAYDRAIHM